MAIDETVPQCSPADESVQSGTMDSTLDAEAGIVISGVSCRLPSSSNMAEFRDNLLARRDMTTEESGEEGYQCYGRWGYLKDVKKFDADFFGISPKQANLMDPQLRMLLEATYEAMIDAGIDPESLRGSQTGVFVGMDISHALEGWISDPENPNSYAAWGCTKTMFANRISYTFDLQGPSYAVQCTNVGSSVALDEAYRSMRAGEIETAVVGGCRMNLKNLDNWSHNKHLQDDPDEPGGDGVVVMILQRSPIAKRIYASILHSKAQVSHVPSGLSYPSICQQTSFLHSLYDEADIDLESIDYMETSSVSNKDELAAISAVFSDSQLIVGSVQPNVGHLHAASGLVSIAKALIAFEEGVFPATIKCPDVCEINCEVANEHIQSVDSLIAINSVGYGGYHAHTILARNEKPKLVPYLASEKQRLCVYASTTEDGVKNGLQFMQENVGDMEAHSLLNETACQAWGNLPYRGFCLLNDTDTTIHTQACASIARPVWYVFSGMGTQWPGMGRKMMTIASFSRSIRESSEVLQPLGLNLYQMIMSGDDKVYDTALHSFVGITAIQIALIEVLREMGVTPDGIIGHSVGEIACGYADGCLTAKEAILAAYWRGKCIQEAGLPPGGMAAVGMTWEAAKAQCPPGIVAACHNSTDTVTISGPAGDITKFVEELKEKQVFAREVRSAGVAFHSPHMLQVAPKLTEALTKLVKGKPRTSRWISTSLPEDQWTTPLARDCSVHYLVNNLTSPVLFQEGLTHVPDNAIVIEIGPHDLLQAILQRSLTKSVFHVGLMKREHSDNVAYMFNSLGKCYMNGLKINPLGIFPRVGYPVAVRTPMLSPVVSWDHSRTWDIPDRMNYLSGEDGQTSCSTFQINVGPDGKDNDMQDHVINGRPMFPASGYILLVWKTLAKFHGLLHTQMAVVMENVMIHRATILPPSGVLKFEVNIMRQLGDFEVIENSEVVCSGKIQRQSQSHFIDDSDYDLCESPLRKMEPQLTSSEVYKELRLRGYHYLDKFQTIRHSDNRGESGAVSWTGDWVTFIDGMMQMVLVARPSKLLLLPTYLASLEINPTLHMAKAWSLPEEGVKVITARVNSDNGVVAGGVKLQGLGVNYSKTYSTQNVLTQEVVFVPYDETVDRTDLGFNLQQYGRDCVLASSKFIQTASKAFSAALQKTSGLEAILKDRDISSKSVDEASYSKFKNCHLISLFSMLNTLPEGENFGENVKNLLDAFETDITTDPLISLLYTPKVLKSCLDTVVENLPVRHLQILEVAKDVKHLHDHVMECMKDKRLMRIDHTVVSKVQLEGAKSVDWDLTSKPADTVGPFHLVILDNVLSEKHVAATLFNISQAIEEDGFIIVKEPTHNIQISFILDVLNSLFSADSADKVPTRHWLNKEQWLDTFKNAGLKLLSVKTDGHLSTVFLLRKQSVEASVEQQVVVDVSDLSCKWVSELKEQLALCQTRPKGENIWLVSEKQPVSGVVGMVKCMALEPGGSRVRCVFLEEDSDIAVPTLKASQYFKQLVQKDLVMNVYRSGKWGSYRHLPLQQDVPKVQTTKSACVVLDGYPPSPVWVCTPPLSYPPDDVDMLLCYPKYCLVDNMETTITNNRYRGMVHDDPNSARLKAMGKVFSGFDHNGKRVMGIVPDKGISTQVYAPKQHVWEVPAEWSLEQACSVPYAYCRAYYGLCMLAKLQKQQSILICGSSLSSQAAVTVAMNIGSKVFIVMETEEERQHLQKQVGEKLKSRQLLLIKDGHFFSDVLQKTSGKGVDLVFDCDGQECYENAVYALKSGGSYLQLVDGSDAVFSKFENLFQRSCSYCAVSLAGLHPRQEERLCHLLYQGLKDKAVKPFDVKVVDKHDLHKVFSQKPESTDTVAINVSNEAVVGPGEVMALQRVMFDPTKCYILVGGLGGFGLELAEWMIERGVTKLMLSSRSGVKTGYQCRKLRLWKGKGVTAQVSTKDVATLESARELIEEAKKLGPVGGVFNLAMVLHDGFLSTLTEDNFQSVCAPKVSGTQHLDNLTRSLCGGTLDWFVTFSSVTSGFGNSGQTNYGFANSAMEQICKQRHKEGLPGLAIQWGAVGDVGVVMDRFGGRDVTVGATMPQRIASCLGTLEVFLLQSQPVVTSFIPETYTEAGQTSGNLMGKRQESLYKTICNILGMKKGANLKPDSKLVDLGLDSLMATEIRQIMERNYKKLLTADQVRELSIGEIKEMSHQQEVETTLLQDASVTIVYVEVDEGSKRPNIWPTDEVIVKLNDIDNDKLPVYIVYDEEYFSEVCDIAAQFECPAFGLHTIAQAPQMSVHSLAGYFGQKLFAKNNNNCEPFILIGHKFGCPVAIEMALQLQELDLVRHVVCIEGSHHFIPLSRTEHIHHDHLTEEQEEEDRENEALFAFVDKFTEIDDFVINWMDEAIEDDMKEKIDNVLELLIDVGPDIGASIAVSKPVLEKQLYTFVQRYLVSCSYTPEEVYKGQMTLIRGRQLHKDVKVVGDYYLSKVCSGSVAVHILNQDHEDFLSVSKDDIVSVLNATIQKAATESAVKAE